MLISTPSGRSVLNFVLRFLAMPRPPPFVVIMFLEIIMKGVNKIKEHREDREEKMREVANRQRDGQRTANNLHSTQPSQTSSTRTPATTI